MHPSAIAKARIRLHSAQELASKLSRCQDYNTFSETWYLFLVAAKGVYTVLEQGTKASSQSRQWFGGINRQRQDDPLLQYLYQARHDAEHGISPFVVEQVPGRVAIGGAKPGYSSAMRIDGSIGPGGRLRVIGLDNKPVLVEYSPSHVRLARVHNRGRYYDPPQEHLGAKLASNLPLHVAELALRYLERVITEAEGLA
jgi:hypothetical protein